MRVVDLAIASLFWPYLTISPSRLLAENEAAPIGPCGSAIANGTPCEAANRHAVELMRGDKLEAITVMQDVSNGNLIVRAASEPSRLDVDTSLLPLSTVKLMVAASWLSHTELPNNEQLFSEALVSGNDNAGRQLASALRKAIGTKGVLRDLERYGFASSHSLGEQTNEKDWADTLSLGEKRFTVTPLQLSQFLRMIATDGAVSKVGTLMRAAVERGTAKSAAPLLAGTGWQMGGKTGTGPDMKGAAGPGSDGWFAGLIFDPQSRARFTVATFVRHGGFGGGNALRISAELAKFIIGNSRAP